MPLSIKRSTDAKNEIRGIRLAGVLSVVLISVMLGGAVLAYSSGARNSLLKSRDQVADQRAQLERAYGEIDRSIQELQQKKSVINRYLRDCDRSISDIDRALNAQDSAVRDMR